ncbi:MAG TPA: CpsB/CapC family capsule biosynthesis tyrosine phosphatase [Chryseolinea sp.]
MFSWFNKKTAPAHAASLHTDIHSHLLPGLDDGVQTYEDAVEIITHFEQLGYRKLITTPHVMSDAYRNTPEIISDALQKLRTHLKDRGIAMEVDAAAEYYLDETVMRMLENNERLLTFGKNLLLFETNFLNEPFNLKEFIFKANTKGYQPVLAHPERYIYLQNNVEKAHDLLDRGVLLQVNISSITGYYSKEAQRTAHKLIDRGWIHLLGSDCHARQHADLVAVAQRMKHFQKALSLPLLNNSL